jgi:hypothetical protein
MLNDFEEPDARPRTRPVHAGRPLDASGRFALAAIALPLGLLSAWMLWVVHRFLDGKGWFDLIVAVVLDEFILAVGLFALTLLIGAIFAPTWLSRAFTAVSRKLVWATTVIAILFGLAFLIVMFVLPVLARLGILR